MSKRDRIRMSEQEVDAFLDEERLLMCASNGRGGWPHLVPLNYVVFEGHPCSWTYAASQKVKNLERDARATISVEAGTEYDELRGLTMTCEVEIIRDTDRVLAFGRAQAARNRGVAPDELPEDAEDKVRNQAPKRVILRFVQRELSTWDHRKLASGQV